MLAVCNIRSLFLVHLPRFSPHGLQGREIVRKYVYLIHTVVSSVALTRTDYIGVDP